MLRIILYMQNTFEFVNILVELVSNTFIYAVHTINEFQNEKLFYTRSSFSYINNSHISNLFDIPGKKKREMYKQQQQ